MQAHLSVRVNARIRNQEQGQRVPGAQGAVHFPVLFGGLSEHVAFSGLPLAASPVRPDVGVKPLLLPDIPAQPPFRLITPRILVAYFPLSLHAPPGAPEFQVPYVPVGGEIIVHAQVPFPVHVVNMLKCLHGVGKLRIGGRILIRKNPAHAAHHVVQDMAVEKPVAARFLRSVKLNHLGVHGLDIRCKLERRKIPMPVHQPEKMPVQMHGMPHHGIVGQDYAHILPFPDHDPVRLGKSFPVNAPYVTVHITGQHEMQFLNGHAGRKSGAGRGLQHVIRQGGSFSVLLHVAVSSPMGGTGLHVHYLHISGMGGRHAVMMHLHISSHGHHPVHLLHLFEVIQLGKGAQRLPFPMAQPQGGRPGSILCRRLELKGLA